MRNLAITARTSVAATLLALATLLCLVIVYLIAITPMSEWYAPHAGPRNYSAVPLAAVVADFEQHHVLPPGTEWTDPDTRAARVTAKWLWVRDAEALQIIARSSNVIFVYPMGHHGEIWAPVRVVRAEPGHGGVERVGRGSLPYRGVRSDE
jgi:hypothetical protein